VPNELAEAVLAKFFARVVFGADVVARTNA
jgi:hypothetical protein